MKRAKVLTIVGGILLLIGLLGTFLSEHYTAQIQGRGRMGIIVFGPTEGSPEWKRTEALLAWADRSFYAGLALTALGIILQTWGGLVALRGEKMHGGLTEVSGSTSRESTNAVAISEPPGSLRELPPGINYPDDDPKILELKRESPDVLWDRYIPSELAVERIRRFRDELAKRDPEAAKNITIPDLPPGTWVYNATWEYETEGDVALEALKKLTKERKKGEGA